MTMTCTNCQETTERSLRGLCRACYAYQHRTGRARPPLGLRVCVDCRQIERKGRYRHGLCARCYGVLRGLASRGAMA